MVSSTKNNRPASPSPSTSSTKETSSTSATKETSSTDETSDIDDLEGMSLEPEAAATMETSTKASSTKASSSTKAATPAVVPANDSHLVGRLLASVIGDLKPGERAVVGGALEGAIDGVAAEGEVEVEIARRPDGKYEVTLTRHGMVGIGAEVNEGGSKHGGKLGLTAGAEVVYVADSMAAATTIATNATLAAAAGSLVLPGVGADVAGAVYAASSDATKEVKIQAGIGGEVAFDFLADAGVAAEGAVGFVYDRETGQAYLEIEANGTFELEGEARGGELEGKLTVRVPLGEVPNPAALADPSVQRALVEQAKAEGAKTTMTFEGDAKVVGGAKRNLLDGGFAVHVTKQIEGNRLGDLFRDGGWDVDVNTTVGPKLKGGIGPGEVEIGAQREVSLRHSHGSLQQAVAAATNDKAKLEGEALRAQAAKR